jgi:hypothetical protein
LRHGRQSRHRGGGFRRGRRSRHRCEGFGHGSRSRHRGGRFDQRSSPTGHSPAIANPLRRVRPAKQSYGTRMAIATPRRRVLPAKQPYGTRLSVATSGGGFRHSWRSRHRDEGFGHIW